MKPTFSVPKNHDFVEFLNCLGGFCLKNEPTTRMAYHPQLRATTLPVAKEGESRTC